MHASCLAWEGTEERREAGTEGRHGRRWYHTEKVKGLKFYSAVDIVQDMRQIVDLVCALVASLVK